MAFHELLLVFFLLPIDFTRLFLSMTLSTLSILLGAVVAALNLFGVLKPAAFAASARKFPRDASIGTVLVVLATGWFAWNLSKESIADFENLKPFLYALFVGVGIGTCIFVRDFLAARGLAVVMLLLAKLMVDTARWVESDWRLVIVTWAYGMVIAGMWFTISPWRLRDLLNWATANDNRTRMGSALRCAFGVFVLILGVTVFRHP
jgi:hypothetical protein